MGEKSRSTGITVPQKYIILSTLFQEKLSQLEKKRKDVIDGKINLTLATSPSEIDYIQYCKDKLNKEAEICKQLEDQINNLGVLLDVLSENELDYIESNKLKSRISEFFIFWDSIEKEWIDALSMSPPDRFLTSHKSFVNTYETYFEAFANFSNNLLSIVNNPIGHFSENNKSELDKEEPKAKLGFILSDKYISLAQAEFDMAIKQDRKLNILGKVIKKSDNPLNSFSDFVQASMYIVWSIGGAIARGWRESASTLHNYRLQPIASMSGKDFEKHLGQLFKNMGYRVKFISTSAD